MPTTDLKRTPEKSLNCIRLPYLPASIMFRSNVCIGASSTVPWTLFVVVNIAPANGQLYVRAVAIRCHSFDSYENHTSHSIESHQMQVSGQMFDVVLYFSILWRRKYRQTCAAPQHAFKLQRAFQSPHSRATRHQTHLCKSMKNEMETKTVGANSNECSKCTCLCAFLMTGHFLHIQFNVIETMDDISSRQRGRHRYIFVFNKIRQWHEQTTWSATKTDEFFGRCVAVPQRRKVVPNGIRVDKTR